MKTFFLTYGLNYSDKWEAVIILYSNAQFFSL